MNNSQKRVVLVAPVKESRLLSLFVEKCLRDKVDLICVVGEGCAKIEDIIDELIVSDGSQKGRFIATTSHPDESLDEVIEFAKYYDTDKNLSVEVVSL